nr:hypothetical protein [Tanacetum cinerariifolium]
MGIVPTEMELILEQTQQGISHEVSDCRKEYYEIQKHRVCCISSIFDKGVKRISQIELFFIYKDPIFESQDMSTSNTHQQSLADAVSETKPPMLERGTAANVQCYNCIEKGHYAWNCPKPRVRDSEYFMEQMLLAKQDEAGVILTDEQNDFFADASQMEEIKELSANICLMARI